MRHSPIQSSPRPGYGLLILLLGVASGFLSAEHSLWAVPIGLLGVFFAGYVDAALKAKGA